MDHNSNNYNNHDYNNYENESNNGYNNTRYNNNENYNYNNNNHMPNRNGQSQTSPDMQRMREHHPMSSPSIFIYPENIPNAISLIEQALGGETEDRIFYGYLIENAPSDDDARIIDGIRRDEMKHYQLFHHIYHQMTGEMAPRYREEEIELPENYCEGLKRALLGEQNAVSRYRQILYAMRSRVHINMLTEIITDEIRHGILYNYLYSKNQCNI